MDQGRVIPDCPWQRHLEAFPLQELSMKRYILVSIAAGLLFALLDGLINANPLALDLYSVYAPIARPSVNAAAGLAIDLLYGFILAGLFLTLYCSLPGGSGIQKGTSFGLITWFLRVVMQAASAWVIFTVPEITLLYFTVAGLGEMLVLGVFLGVTLKLGDLPFFQKSS
jgi:hypothetical protein